MTKGIKTKSLLFFVGLSSLVSAARARECIDTDIKFSPKEGGNKLTCSQLSANMKAQYCSKQQAGINTLTDAACPLTCGKCPYNAGVSRCAKIPPPAFASRFMPAKQRKGLSVHLTKFLRKRRRKGMKRIERNCSPPDGGIHTVADAACPLTCGKCVPVTDAQEEANKEPIEAAATAVSSSTSTTTTTAAAAGITSTTIPAAGIVPSTTTTPAAESASATTPAAESASATEQADALPSSTLSSTASEPKKTKDRGPPNILLLYADQHQGACLGSENHPDVLTPHLDALAASGVKFTRAYVNDGICAPSRQSFMSGLHPRTLGSLDNRLHPLTTVQKEATSLAETLKSNGYATAAFGKRHLGTHAHRGLDEGWDVHYSHRLARDKVGTYYNWIEDAGTDTDTGKSYMEEFTIDRETCDDHDLCTQQSSLPPDKTMEAWTAMKSIDYIREHAAQNRDKNDDEIKPFFMWSTFFRPHQPYNPQPKFEAMYEDVVKNYKSEWGSGLKNGGGQIAMPSNLEQPMDDLPRGLKNKRRSTKVPWNCGTAADDHQIYRDYMAAYYALVTEVDHYVGDILRALEEEGLSENTVVIYTSDHGDFAGRHGLSAKIAPAHTTYEEIYRVPLIVRYPHHFQKGRVVNDLTEAVDMYPTILQLAGIDDKDDDGYPLQGKSLVPAMTTEDGVTGTEYVVAENWSSMTIITARFKLTRWLSGNELHPELSSDYSDNPDLLFDRSYDEREGEAFPLETVNLYDVEKYRGVRDELENMLDEWIKRTNKDGREEKYKHWGQ